jgi:hypothetical protein
MCTIVSFLHDAFLKIIDHNATVFLIKYSLVFHVKKQFHKVGFWGKVCRIKCGAPPAGAGGSFPKRDIPRLFDDSQVVQINKPCLLDSSEQIPVRHRPDVFPDLTKFTAGINNQPHVCFLGMFLDELCEAATIDCGHPVT